MIFAAVIGDYCSEIMPLWWCTMFQSPTALLIQTVILIALVGAAFHRPQQQAR